MNIVKKDDADSGKLFDQATRADHGIIVQATDRFVKVNDGAVLYYGCSNRYTLLLPARESQDDALYIP